MFIFLLSIYADNRLTVKQYRSFSITNNKSQTGIMFFDFYIFFAAYPDNFIENAPCPEDRLRSLVANPNNSSIGA